MKNGKPLVIRFHECELGGCQDGLVNRFGVLSLTDELNSRAHRHGSDYLVRLGKEWAAQDLVGFQVFCSHRVTFVTDSQIRFTMVLVRLHGKS